MVKHDAHNIADARSNRAKLILQIEDFYLNLFIQIQIFMSKLRTITKI